MAITTTRNEIGGVWSLEPTEKEKAELKRIKDEFFDDTREWQKEYVCTPAIDKYVAARHEAKAREIEGAVIQKENGKQSEAENDSEIRF